MRAAKVKEVGRVGPGDHVYLAFGNDEEQQDVVGDFIADGLALGEKVVFIGDTSTADTIADWLRGRPATAVAGRGTLEVRAAGSVLLPGGRFDAESVLGALTAEVEAVRHGEYSGLRLAVEMSWVLQEAPGSSGLPYYERRLQDLFDAGGVTGLCLYDRRLFDGGVVGYLTDCHPSKVEANALHDGRMLRLTRTYEPAGLRVRGAVDMTTVGALTAVLDKRVASERGDVHLDLSELEFIDVAGLRTLVETAAGLQGRALRLANLAPALRRVVSVVGWDQSPGLYFEDKAVSW